MSRTPSCPKCSTALEDAETFNIAPELRAEFFGKFGRPLCCPACRKEYGVENGVAAYEVEDGWGPGRSYGYVRYLGRTVFEAHFWPSPDNMGSYFRLEDLGEQLAETGIPTEDLSVHLADSDLEALGPTINAFMGAESAIELGDVWVYPNGSFPDSVVLEPSYPQLPYHELCRRMLAFYEPGSSVDPGDMRFYQLIWKLTLRIYRKHAEGGQHALARLKDLGFLDSVRAWAEEEYGAKIRLTPQKIRAIRAVVEHYAFTSLNISPAQVAP
jgi:hypothetical protein